MSDDNNGSGWVTPVAVFILAMLVLLAGLGIYHVIESAGGIGCGRT